MNKKFSMWFSSYLPFLKNYRFWLISIISPKWKTLVFPFLIFFHFVLKNRVYYNKYHSWNKIVFPFISALYSKASSPIRCINFQKGFYRKISQLKHHAQMWHKREKISKICQALTNFLFLFFFWNFN